MDPTISATVRYFFTGEGEPDKVELFMLRGSTEREKAAWETIRAEVMPTWIADHPCSRHSAWWRFDSTEQRRRLGGTGDTHDDHYEPSECDRGIPTDWFTQWESDFYNGRTRDIHGKKIEKWPSGYYEEGDHPGTPISAEDPPTFESETAYLQRHGLLTPAEVRHLAAHPELLAPEPVVFDEDDDEDATADAVEVASDAT
jgi:hypothetical protein